MRINIKPLSINIAFQGRRFKTPKYKAFENHCLLLLKPMIIGKEKLSLSIIFGLSNKMSDVDNGAKPFIDILQKKYGFNDNQIYELHLYKEIVDKGNEFIDFSIQTL
jgi:Holliday junction resolvase RusA-like endonuclease